jgi:DNA-binding IclR family transcriptional regulator
MSTTVAKAIRCLAALGARGAPTSVAEIASEVGISRPGATRLLQSLAEAGVVARDQDSGKYVLGLKLHEWGAQAATARSVVQDARKEIVRTMPELRRPVDVGVLDGEDILLIERVEWQGELVIAYPLAVRGPWYRTASGKVLVALGTPAQGDVLLTKLRAAVEPVHYDELIDELRTVKARGYGEVRGVLRPNLFGASFPIFDRRGCAIATLGAPARPEEWKEEMAFLCHVLGSCAKRVSERLGYRASTDVI